MSQYAKPDVNELITDNLDIWTSAIKQKSTQGRGSSSKTELYGIKKLRGLILDLAVRGLLVPQDPNDEPASVLLEKISAEKAQLVKEKKIKKQKPQSPIRDDEKSFLLPEGWLWVRMGNIGETNIGLTYKPANVSDSGVPVLRSSNIQNSNIDLTDLVRVAGIEIKDSAKLEVGDLLICARNGSKALVGKTAQIQTLNEPMAFGAFMAVFRSNLNAYIERFLNSPLFRGKLDGVDTTTINQITQNNLKSTVVPIPPYSEQLRIVAKVDELMALCDQLEQKTEHSINHHQTLIETLLDALVDSLKTRNQDGATAFAEAWQRIFENFDVLFTTEHAVEKLKQTILQLAVMGRLVPQESLEEDANLLLSQIASKKEILIKAGKLKKQKKAKRFESSAIDHPVPEGWVIADFGDITFNRDAERIPLSVNERQGRQGEFDYYGASGVIDSIDGYLFDKPLLLIGEDGANLVNRSTPIAFIAKGKYWVNNHAHVIDGISLNFLEYLALFINSISLLPYITGMAQPKMNQAKMNSIPVLLPPESEQIRILSKVAELLALCDQLLSSIQIARTTQMKIATVLSEVNV